MKGLIIGNPVSIPDAVYSTLIDSKAADYVEVLWKMLKLKVLFTYWWTKRSKYNLSNFI